MSTKRKKIKARWWHIVLIALCVIAFCGLAYWQWTRFQSGTGTFQNLGYAFQWPLFAVFVVYAYRTAIRYENERIDAENDAAEAGDTNFKYSAHTEQTGSNNPIASDFLPQRQKLSVEEFNELNRPRRGHGAGTTDSK